MRRKSKLPELLAPAGSEEALYAAVAAGADAVYLGGRSFGARAFAENFDEEQMRRAVRYAHLHGVKVYVTVNISIYDRELCEAAEYCASLYRMGVDAVIAADVGLISLLRRRLPALEVHASTQMSLHNTEGVRFAAALGATRAVVARELPLAEIRRVTKESPLEIEVFLHGALCVSHSGQCLFSSLVGGRSGNRGECAQPCRLPYNGEGRYPLSLRDLCLASHIRELCDAGVASLKIEGRMKSADYVYRVTRIYRTLLDEGRDATEAELCELSRIFSRSGATDGYFIGHPERRMTGVRTEEDKAATRALGEERFAPLRVSVRARAVFALDLPSALTLYGKKGCVTVYGDTPQPAQNAPLQAEDLKARLGKMGNTFLSLAKEDIEVSLEAGINLPPSSINALRRAAAEAYETCDRDAALLPCERATAPLKERLTTACFFDVRALCAMSEEALSFFDVIFVSLFDYAAAAGRANGVALPPVLFDGAWEAAHRTLLAAEAAGARYALVSNPSALSLLSGTRLLPIGDFRLNVTNRESAAHYAACGVGRLILSPELTLPMLRDIGGGAIVYGRIPLMLTERCFVRENGGCDQCGHFAFVDRRGKRFSVLREAEHRNLILNSVVTYMGDRAAALDAAGILHRHFLFTVESAREISEVIDAFRNGRTLEGEVRRIKS